MKVQTCRLYRPCYPLTHCYSLTQTLLFFPNKQINPAGPSSCLSQPLPLPPATLRPLSLVKVTSEQGSDIARRVSFGRPARQPVFEPPQPGQTRLSRRS